MDSEDSLAKVEMSLTDILKSYPMVTIQHASRSGTDTINLLLIVDH